MKVIHIALGKANPERMNGVNRVVHQLASIQQSMGCDVTLWGITPNPIHDYPKRSYETVLFQSISNKFKIDPQLKKEIEKIAYSVDRQQVMFHIHGGWIPEFYHLAKALSKKDLPYIYTPHGAYNPIAMERSELLKRIYFALFEKSIIRRAKAVHLLGQSSFDHLNDLVYVNNKVLISNGIGLSSIPKINKKQNAEPLFGTCGRIDIHTKGLDILLQGFAKYKKDKGKGKLQIVGDGDELERLKSMAIQLGVSSHVIFLGAKYGSEKYMLLNNLDVFIQPSRNEGFPVTVLEAACLCIPCLVSEATNVGAYIRQHEAGFVLQKNDPHHIALEMHKAADLFSANRLDVLGLNARQMVREKFDWPKVAQEYIDLYKMPLEEWRLRKNINFHREKNLV